MRIWRSRHTGNVRVDSIALFVNRRRCSTRLTGRVEVLLPAELFPRELSGSFERKSVVSANMREALNGPVAEAMVVAG